MASERDVRAILDAAGLHDADPTTRRRVREALDLYTRSLYTRVTRARDKWAERARRMRDKHEPYEDRWPGYMDDPVD